MGLTFAALFMTAAGPLYAGSKGKPEPTSREYVTSANSMEISTTRRRSTYDTRGKKVFISEARKYQVTSLTRVEIDGKVSEAASLLPKMVVTIVADRQQSMEPDDKGVLLARMVTATTKAKPPGSK